MLKKLIIGFVAILMLLIVAVVSIPFFIDVDQFRPQIVSAVNENINGKVGMKSLKLSLWGQVKVMIEDLTVEDPSGDKMVEVGEAFVHLPFSSIFGGKPQLDIKIKKPVIKVIKYKNGKLNLLTLVKESKPSASNAGKEKTADVPANESAPTELDPKVKEYITQSSVNLELTDATLSFHDQLSNFLQQVKGFNLLLSDVSMSKTMSLRIWSEIKTKVGKDLEVFGPIEISGTVSPVFKDLEFQNFSTKMKLNFDDIVIDVPKTFRKEKGAPTNIDLAATIGLTELDVSQLDINFLDVTARSKASIKRLNNPPEKIHFELLADKPGVDLNLNLDVVSISKPDIDLVLKSNGIDLDILFPPSPEAIEERKKAAEKAAQEKESRKPEVEEPTVDVDGMLAPLRENQMLKDLQADADIRIKKFSGMQTVAENIVLVLAYKNLRGSLKTFSANAFDGKISSSASFDLKPERPVYDFAAEVEHIDLGGAVATHLETLSQTLKGHLNFKVKARGKSLNSDRLIKNLKAKGNFSVNDSQFATFDVSQMVTEAVTKGLGDLEKKYPQIKGKVKLGSLKDQVSRYEYIRSDFSMNDGVFKAPSFTAKSLPKQGIDITGNTEVDLVGDKLSARWAVVDTHNQTKLKDVDINVKGFQIEEVLSEKGKPVEFPVAVACKLSEPCFKYDALPGHFLGIAQKKISDKAKGLIDAEKRKLQARVDAEKEKLQKKLALEKKKLQDQKKKKMAELEKKKKELERRKKEEERKAKEKAKEKAKSKLKDKFGKKLGF